MLVTMKDIAKAAGVSVVTVSRAFNDKPDIDIKTKKRIMDLAREMNYWPNILAKSLRDKKTKSIGIVVPDMSDPFYAEFLHGCSNTARELGYQIILSVLSQRGCDVEEELEAIRTLIGKRVDGLLLQPEHEDKLYLDALKVSPIPFVLWNRQPEGLECSFVTNDHALGSKLATKHLIDKGHREITYFVRYPKTGSVKARVEGCYRAIREANMSNDALKIIECGDSAKDAYDLTKHILEQGEKPTAMYTWDDVMAIGALKAIKEKGYQIPMDIAIIGYNDIELAEFVSPPLTTVRQKTIEIGETASRMLVEKIEGDSEDNFNTNVLVVPELIVRKTT